MTSARDLTSRLAVLLRQERGALADFLVLLADFDRRRLWLELGHASLFSFLHRELGLSRGAAHYRKTAAELVQRFPDVIEPLRDGRLCITSVVELARVLTQENRAQVLPRFFNLSKREAAEVAAEIRPVENAPRREVVTAVRVAAPAPRATEPAPLLVPAEGSTGSGVQLEGRPHANSARPSPAMMSQAPVPPAPKERAVAEPLTADLRRLHVTVSRGFLAKLDAARSALSHARPGASAEEILEAGLDLLLAKDAKKKALVGRPRKKIRPSKPDHVPAHVRREVWTRDGGRCQWPLDSGGICGSTLRPELDHVVPEACGGAPTAGNLRVLCRVHNEYAARLAFGGEVMDRFRRQLTAPRGRTRAPSPRRTASPR